MSEGDYKSRLSTEKKELEDKINKLTIFIASDLFRQISESSRNLLIKQEKVMKEYAEILSQRIEL